MQLEKPSALRRKEIYRYLACPENSPAADDLLDRCEADLLAAAQPRGVWRILLREQAPASLLLDEGDIAHHLEGCSRLVLMAVTLGAGVERLLRRYSATDVALATAADAAASVLVDQMADLLEAHIRSQLAKEYWYMTGRYSPGYGNWPLPVQADLCRVLDTGRAIGLGVSASYLMAPRKSVTAALGVADHPVKGRLAGCGHCVLRDTCGYRKRGTTCADS